MATTRSPVVGQGILPYCSSPIPVESTPRRLLRRPSSCAIELQPARVFDLLVEEVAQEGSDSRNRREVTDFVPGRRKRRADEIGGELKRQRRNQPLREVEPDGAAALSRERRRREETHH